MKIFLSFLFTLTLSLSLLSQNSNPCRKSTEGTDFWFGFMEGRHTGNNHYLEIAVSSRVSTTFNVYTGPNKTLFSENISVGANQTTKLQIPSNLVEPKGSETIENMGIYLKSEAPVNLYALNFDNASADVALIYPIESLGTEHFAVCYTPGAGGNTGRNSEFLIVAAEDETTIQITPSVETDKGKKADSTFLVTLNQGQVYQVQSYNQNLPNQGDLTGSYVESDKPIAFYSGSHGARIPAGTCCWDHLYEQVPPLQSWGKEYFTVPLKTRKEDRYRIVAASNNTKVDISNGSSYNLNKGEFKEIILTQNQPSRIIGDKPIMVAQYSQSRDVDESYTGGNGDPFMIILSSTSQSKRDVTFTAYEGGAIEDYYINIICKRSERNNLLLSGTPISNFKDFPNSDYSFAQVDIQPNNDYRLYSNNGDVEFLAYVYGFGNPESYGYGVGFNLDLVLDLGESINFNGDTLSLCHGESRTLDAGPYFDNYEWNTGDTAQTIEVTEGGKYKVKTATMDGCILEDSIFIYVSNPMVDLGYDSPEEGCYPYSLQLNGGDNFKTYLWENAQNDSIFNEQLFTIDTTGEYRLTATDIHGCIARDTMSFVVLPTPVTSINGDTILCGVKQSQLSVSITSAPESVWNNDSSFTWSSNNPDLTFSNSTASSTTFEVLDSGHYIIYYKLETIHGCVSSDTFNTYVSLPTVFLGYNMLEERCYPDSIQLDGGDGFETYLWENGQNDSIYNEQIIDIDTSGEYRITVTNEYGCIARDTMNFIMHPTAIPEISGDTLLCGIKQSQLFVSMIDAPEEVWNNAYSYTWASSSPGLTFSNSTVSSTTFNVLNWGIYNIYYKIETIHGCISSDTFQVSLQQTPASDFIFVDNPDDPCKGYTREVLYTGNASKNAEYYWDYGGSTVTDSMDWNNFTVSLGTFNSEPFIQLYLEENGCWSDTTEQSIGANPDFILETEEASGCDTATIVFSGTLKTEDNLLFEWDFGDGSPVSNDRNVSHFYQDTGFYDVSLKITNLFSGCDIGFQIDSMIKIFPTPTADITVDPTQCYADSTKIFYTHSIDSSICYWNLQGAHQSGNGTDTINVIIDNPIGTVELTVDEYGCVSTPVEVELKRLPHFDFFTDTLEGCQPFTVEIFASPQDDHLEFTWLNDTLTTSGLSKTYHFVDSGRFDIGIIAESRETGCLDTLIKTEWIWSHPKPLAAFDVNYPVATIKHAEITYYNQSESATQYLWDFGDDSETSTEIEPTHTFSAPGEFYTTLYVESDYFCTDTTILMITIFPSFDVETPNAFRPDSQIEGNRTYMPVPVGVDPDRFNLKIFDRWGQVIFESNSPETPWDGAIRNGNPAPMGNYIWIAHFFDIQGFEHNLKGQVLLVR